jgi:hypothetical protein
MLIAVGTDGVTLARWVGLDFFFPLPPFLTSLYLRRRFKPPMLSSTLSRSLLEKGMFNTGKTPSV